MRQVGSALLCLECGAESDEEAQGWRAYLVPADEDDPEGRVLTFCPRLRETRVRPLRLEIRRVLNRLR